MRRTLSIVVMVSLVACGSAFAQEEPPQRGRARAPRGADPLSPITVAEMLDAYALVQAQKALSLNDSQYAQFVTRLKKLQETRRRNLQERNRILQDLRRLAGPERPPSVEPQEAPAPAAPRDDAAIRERIRAWRELEARRADEIARAYDALDEVLDARQQARFRLFEEQIERRKFDLIIRARQRAARGGQ